MIHKHHDNHHDFWSDGPEFTQSEHDAMQDQLVLARVLNDKHVPIVAFVSQADRALHPTTKQEVAHMRVSIAQQAK